MEEIALYASKQSNNGTASNIRSTRTALEVAGTRRKPLPTSSADVSGTIQLSRRPVQVYLKIPVCLKMPVFLSI